MFTFCITSLSACSRYYSGPPSNHFDGNRFYNPGKPPPELPLGVLRWQLTSEKKFWPEKMANRFDAKPPERVEGDKLLVTNIGHATVLMQTQGLNILTDPVFSERASPVSWAGPKRVHEPGVKWENLPKIDVVLISHNHYDHLDTATLARLWERDKPRIIVPLGNDTIINNHNPDIIAEAYDLGAAVKITPAVIIHLEPTQHWSARGIFDRNKSLWASYTLETPGGKIYFVGDSGYGEGDNYRTARNKHGDFRFAILPIGAYEPRWFMKYSHMNPEEAVLAFHDLGQPYAIPTHFDVFPLADEGYGEAASALSQAKAKSGAEKFRRLEVGEQWEIPLK